MRPIPVLLALALLPAALTAQQPVSLRQALARADSTAFPNRVAGAQVARADADRTAALAGVLPSARMEAGYMRSNDPLVAFGFLLRQRDVSAASFDPALLNNPAARGDMQAGFAAELPLINLDAWSGRTAASHAAGAEAARAEWTRLGVQVQVTEAWAGAVVARERVRMLQSLHAAASAHVRQAGRMAEQGLVTRSDVLRASVHEGEMEAQLEAARGEREMALRSLALAMGTPDDTTLTVPDSLPGVLLPSQGPNTDSLRSDLRAAHLAQAAAEAGADRAGRAMLPRLNAFGRYDWHDPTTPFGGQGMWTAGVQFSWSPFTSAREVAARGAARAGAVAARAAVAQAEAAAELEVARARIRVRVAERSLAIADRAVVQGTEAHRIVTRQYEGGLVGISDLLDAAATETATRLGLARARFELVASQAALLRAEGQDLTPLVVALEGPGRNTP